MIFQKDKFLLLECADFEEVKNEIVRRGEADFEYHTIKRAVAIWHDHTLCGFLMTCEFNGVKSFHGFKFVKGGLQFQMPMTRKYIDEEGLEFSSYLTRKTEMLLKILGFKEIGNFNGVPIMRRSLCLQS